MSEGATGLNSGNAVASENKINITRIAVIIKAKNSSGVTFWKKFEDGKEDNEEDFL